LQFVFGPPQANKKRRKKMASTEGRSYFFAHISARSNFFFKNF